MSREDDVKKLVDGVLATGLIFHDNPNGGYEYTCPFCCAFESVGGNVSEPTIETIKHDLHCIYLVAKDLAT